MRVILRGGILDRASEAVASEGTQNSRRRLGMHHAGAHFCGDAGQRKCSWEGFLGTQSSCSGSEVPMSESWLHVGRLEKIW